MLAIDFHIGDIVFENGGDVYLVGEVNIVAIEGSLSRSKIGVSQLVLASVEARVMQRRGSRIADLWEGTLGKNTGGESGVSSGYVPGRSCPTATAEEVEAYINRQVFPQAPSPTMTSLRRISAMLCRCTRQQNWPCLEEEAMSVAVCSAQKRICKSQDGDRCSVVMVKVKVVVVVVEEEED